MRNPWLSHKARRAALPYLFLTPTVALLGLLMLLPMIVVVRYSLLDNAITQRHPEYVGLENFITVFLDETFQISALNTLYFTVMSVVFHLALGLGFALLLNSPRVNRHLRNVLRVLYILPWLFTAVIIAIVWRLLLDPLGVINNLLIGIGIINTNVEWFSSTSTALHALTFVNIWAGYPLYMVSLLAGLQGVPPEQYEAANMDGAGAFHRFWYITLPHLMPIVVSIALLDFIWTMQVFPLVWMTTGGGPIHTTEMLSTYTYKLAFTRYQFGLAAASAVIMLVLSMCVTWFYVRARQAVA